MDCNRVFLVGRLTKKPILKEGRDPRCQFTLAVNRVVSNRNGPQTDYIPCVLWGSQAEGFYRSVDKGDEVGITGRIRTSVATAADGSARYYWEIRVDEVRLGRKAARNLSDRRFLREA